MASSPPIVGASVVIKLHCVLKGFGRRSARDTRDRATWSVLGLLSNPFFADYLPIAPRRYSKKQTHFHSDSTCRLEREPKQERASFVALRQKKSPSYEYFGIPSQARRLPSAGCISTRVLPLGIAFATRSGYSYVLCWVHAITLGDDRLKPPTLEAIAIAPTASKDWYRDTVVGQDRARSCMPYHTHRFDRIPLNRYIRRPRDSFGGHASAAKPGCKPRISCLCRLAFCVEPFFHSVELHAKGIGANFAKKTLVHIRA